MPVVDGVLKSKNPRWSNLRAKFVPNSVLRVCLEKEPDNQTLVTIKKERDRIETVISPAEKIEWYASIEFYLQAVREINSTVAVGGAVAPEVMVQLDSCVARILEIESGAAEKLLNTRRSNPTKTAAGFHRTK